MADYKVVFRADRTTEGEGALGWEAGCPLLFEAIQVSRNVDTGKAYLQAKVLNVSAAVVDAFRASFEVVQRDGSVERVDSESLDADISSARSLNLTPMMLAAGDVKLVRGRIDWARTSSGDWSAGATLEQVSRPRSLGLSERALGERYEQLWAPLATVRTEPSLKRAAENEAIVGVGWWVCPCGQPNVGRKTCAVCGISYERLSDPKMQDLANLEAAADKREAEAREAASKAKRKKAIAAVAVVAVAAVAILASAGVFAASHFEKQAEYDRAVELFEQGDYQKAAAAFSGLGDFTDAKSRANEASEKHREDRYDAAMEAYESGDYRRAMVEFESLALYAKGEELEHLQEMRDKAAAALPPEESMS